MSKEFQPLVSIVIPVYNGSKYMREAIDSALAQTYPNIEVLVINDGSKDSGATHEIALSYGDKIRYFVKENGGVSTALNMGIRHMRGEYFSWLSHDDVYYPYKIEKCIAAIKDCPDRIVYSDYETIDGNGKLVYTENFRKFFRFADFEYGLFPIMNGAANGCTMLIPCSNFDNYGMFDETERTTQDYSLFFKMFRGQRLVYINKPLTKYRSHSSQQTHINPVTVAEGDALWIKMFEQLTEEEIIHLGGSPRMFWRQKARMLTAGTAFHGAARFAQEKYEACVSAHRNAKISVIMPFYNRLDLMPKTIESVINQTHANWELILANDGTTEDISKIEEIANQDKRIKIISLPHRGASAARNSAISASSGEYVALLDSDDLWAPEKLEKQLNYMLDNGYAFSHTSFEQRYLNGDLLASYDVSQFCGDVFFLSIYTWSICTCCVMFERLPLGKARFPEHIRMGEDICLWFHFLWRYEVGAVSDVLTTVRVQGSSASQSMDKRREALHSVIGFLLQNYNYEECMPYVGLLTHGFASLFPPLPAYNAVSPAADMAAEPVIGVAAEQTINADFKPTIYATARPIPPRSYLHRFLLGLKRHGFIGFWRIFGQRVKLKLKRIIYHEGT